MRFGIHRKLLRAMKVHLNVTVFGILSGAAALALSSHSAFSARFHFHDMLPVMLLGIAICLICGTSLIKLFRWLRRATWVLAHIEPVAMRLSMRTMPSRCLGVNARVDLLPLNAKSRVGPRADLPVVYARSRHRRHTGKHKIPAVV